VTRCYWVNFDSKEIFYHTGKKKYTIFCDLAIYFGKNDSYFFIDTYS